MRTDAACGQRWWLVGLLIGTSALVVGCRESAAPRPNYTVDDYDPQRDPAEDLADTIRRADAENKRILLQVGGQWCGWCHKLDRYVAQRPAVATALNNNFLIMKVNFSDDNKNEAFLDQFPDVPGYPHLFVLDVDGRFLHSQPTADLEEDDSYSESALLQFLSRWSAVNQPTAETAAAATLRH